MCNHSANWNLFSNFKEKNKEIKQYVASSLLVSRRSAGKELCNVVAMGITTIYMLLELTLLLSNVPPRFIFCLFVLETPNSAIICNLTKINLTECVRKKDKYNCQVFRWLSSKLRLKGTKEN